MSGLQSLKAGFLKLIALILALVVPVLFMRGSNLTVKANDDKSVEEVIKQGFYSFKEKINIEEFQVLPSELGEIFSSVIKNDPYLFYISPHLSFSYKAGGCVLSIKPAYTMSSAEAGRKISFCREKIIEISSVVCPMFSDFEKALFIHDYLCQNFDYDLSLENDNLYDFLNYKKGTCQGYTLAYIALLRECGINSCFVASDTISHMWTLANIDGEWYHIDVTWDDPISAKPQYRHFLCSDRDAEEKGHRDWYSPAKVNCSSEIYQGFDFADYIYSCSLDLNHSGNVDLRDLLSLRAQDNSACSFAVGSNFAFCNVDLMRKKILLDN